MERRYGVHQTENMEQEFLSEAEIGERFPGEWVLVKQAEFDEQWRVVRGVVAAHSVNREEITRAHAEIAHRGEPFSVSVLCFKEEPADLMLMLPWKVSQ